MSKRYKSHDHRIFSNTAAKTKPSNIAGRYIPRGGTRK